MSVRLDGDLVRLEGDCHLEDAESLTGLLASGGRTVSLDGCRRLHGAVLQALLTLRPRTTGRLDDPQLEARLGDLLRREAS